MANPSSSSRVLPLLGIIFLLAIFTWAGLSANAAWHYRTAENITHAMLESGELTQAGIDAANARVKLALQRRPKHPDYLGLAGNLQELLADQPGVVGKVHRAALESAANYYRKALAVRPLWPHDWANLLAAKDKLGELDDEFVLALTRSIETGPWTPRVQLQVISSGLNHWDGLAPTEQSMVREKVIDGLQIQPRETFDIVKSYGRPDLVCVQAVNHARIQRWCDLVYHPGEES